MIADLERPRFRVDFNFFGTSYAWDSKTASDNRCVTGLTATSSQDTLGGHHAMNVIGVGFISNQNHLFTRTAVDTATGGHVSIENRDTNRSSR